MTNEDNPVRSNLLKFEVPVLDDGGVSDDECCTPGLTAGDTACLDCPLAEVIELRQVDDVRWSDLESAARRIMLKAIAQNDWSQFKPLLEFQYDESDVSTIIALMRNGRVSVAFGE